MISEKEINHYLKQIRTLVPVHAKNEKRYLRDLTDSITQFAKDNPEATMQNIIEQYGSPMEVVRDYIESCDVDLIIKRITLQTIVRRLVVVILLCLFIALSCFLFYIHKAYLDSKNTIITNTETVISDE